LYLRLEDRIFEDLNIQPPDLFPLATEVNLNLR